MSATLRCVLPCAPAAAQDGRVSRCAPSASCLRPATLRSSSAFRPLRRSASACRSRVSVTATLQPGDSTQPGGPPKSSSDVMIDPVVGSRRASNYFWASVVTGGASGFLVTGISAYVHHNLIWFLDASEVQFFPQGLVMSFYGVAGLTLALYLWLTIAWDVGSGYNEFNKQTQLVRIFRFGFPGKDRRINLTSPLADVRSVRVEVKDGVNPRRVLYLCLKGRSDIPLTRIGQPMALEELEGRAAALARFLQVPIEGL